MKNILNRFISTYNFVFDDNAEMSLLSKKESNAIKGLLILLVVLGHNKYLMQGGFSNVFLYSFHVYAFFFLPFLYNFKKESFGKLLLKNLKRLYIPYTCIFFVLCILAILQHTQINYLKLFSTYICGTQYMLSDLFGFGSFLWFIPTLFSVLLVRWLFYNSNKYVRGALFLMSFACLIIWAFMVYPPLWFYAPFGFFVAFSMLAPAVICRALFRYLKSQAIQCLFFVLVLVLMIVYPLRDSYQYLYLTINRLLCPNLILLFILSIRQYLSELQWCRKIGIQSFKIYLIHIFLYNAAYLLLDKTINVDLYLGLILFVVVFLLSYGLSKLKLMNLVFR